MSLIFEALKKGRAAVKPPVFGSESFIASVSPLQNSAVTPLVRSAAATGTMLPWVFTVLAGMLLVGAGAWLYWAGKASNRVVSVASVPSVQVASSPAPVPAPALMLSPVAPLSAVVLAGSKPITTAAAVATQALVLPTRVVAPVLVVSQVAKVDTPELVTEIKPVNRPPINTQVQVSSEANSFDVREAFQSFLQRVQTGQLPEAQVAADKISMAMGRSHVMSLRAQGYLALKKNELVQAKSQYLQLHQLLPEDREAGLNLALIDWLQGEKDSAAKRATHLLEKFPNDPEIQALFINVRNP